ncbi:MAG: hypothetical protein HOV79_23765 [Hamadaea sp.]|nr:hypothetical protein [Hamadaea sp.]
MTANPETPHELVGFWSAEHGRPSTMEDECLMFRPDGTGWYEYARLGYSRIILFRWRPVSQGRVRLEAYHEIEWSLAADPAPPRQRRVRRMERLTFQIAEHPRPLLTMPVRVLALRFSFGELPSSGEPAYAFVGPAEPDREIFHKVASTT